MNGIEQGKNESLQEKQINTAGKDMLSSQAVATHSLMAILLFSPFNAGEAKKRMASDRSSQTDAEDYRSMQHVRR